jgi:hypothetical protein
MVAEDDDNGVAGARVVVHGEESRFESNEQPKLALNAEIIDSVDVRNGLHSWTFPCPTDAKEGLHSSGNGAGGEGGQDGDLEYVSHRLPSQSRADHSFSASVVMMETTEHGELESSEHERSENGTPFQSSVCVVRNMGDADGEIVMRGIVKSDTGQDGLREARTDCCAATVVSRSSLFTAVVSGKNGAYGL